MAKPTSKKTTVSTAVASATVEKASKVDLKNTRTSLAQVKTKVTDLLAEIEETLVTKGADLEAIDGAIVIKKEQLAELHGKDEVLLEMDELKIRRDQIKVSSDAERKRLDEEDRLLRDDAAKARAREAAEHERVTKLSRKTDEDNYQYEKALRERALAEKEAAATAKQAEYDKAIAKVARFDDEVKVAAEEKAKAQVEAISRNYKHTADLVKAATDAEILNLKKDIEHRDATIKTQQADLASLRTALATAQAAQTELAKATVDSARIKEAHTDAMGTLLNISGANGKSGRAS